MYDLYQIMAYGRDRQKELVEESLKYSRIARMSKHESNAPRQIVSALIRRLESIGQPQTPAQPDRAGEIRRGA